MVLQTLVFPPFNHLTRLVEAEELVILSRRESLRLFIAKSRISFHGMSQETGPSASRDTMPFRLLRSHGPRFLAALLKSRNATIQFN